MALKATIFKAQLNVADMDRHYYASHQLTLARHPSETDERLMVRLLAFAAHAHEALECCKGISNDDEPDLWQKSLSGQIECWIELGQPDESRIRKACNQAAQVYVYAYGGRAVPLWWQKHQAKLSRFDNLTVVHLPQEGTQALAQMAQRNMTLQCTIEDGQMSMGDDVHHLVITPERIYPA